MENDSELEERFKLVLELNYTLEELAIINSQLKLLKGKNINLKYFNNDKNKELSEKKLIWNEEKSKNEFLLKELQEINDNINKLKKELNNIS